MKASPPLQYLLHKFYVNCKKKGTEKKTNKPKEKYLNRFFKCSFLTKNDIPKSKIHQFKGEKRKSTILDKIKNIKLENLQI
jgi:hypothetical protein